LSKKGQLEEAAIHYRHAMELSGDIAPALIGLGTVYAGQGKTNEAESFMRQGLALQPSPAAQFQLADFLLAQQRLDEARVHYLQGLAQAPYHAVAHNQLGNLYARQRNWVAAREQYENAVNLNPRLAGVHDNLGKVLAFQGQIPRAKEEFSKAIDLAPQLAGAHNDLGHALAIEGNLDGAINEYRAALARNPDFAEAHLNLGEALARRGELPRAQAEFEAALRCQTNFARARFALAGVSLAQQRSSDAIRHLREAVRLETQWVEPLNNLAWLLATDKNADLRDGAEAVRLARRALELSNTNDWERLDTLAAAEAEAGRFGEAAASERTALALATHAACTNVAPLSNRLALFERGLPYREP